MDAAIAGHTPLVHALARRLDLRPGDAGWDDAISDGMLALWQALSSYDPTRWDLDRYLAVRVRHRMIDGLRQRTNNRASHRPTIVPLDEAGDLPTEQPHMTAHAELGEVVNALADIDPRLPSIAMLLLAGYTRTETGARYGLSRTRIWQLLTQAGSHYRAA